MALSSLRRKPETIEDESFSQAEKSIKNALARFESQGIQPPKPEKTKASILQRVFSVLRVADPAPYAMAAIKGESLGKVAGLQLSRAWQTGVLGQEVTSATRQEEKIYGTTFSDILEEMGWQANDTTNRWSRAAVGLGLDVVLDPKTWITFGTARTAAKVFVPKKGIASISKKGTQQMNKLISEFGEEAGRKAFATEVAKTGSKYLAPSGMKFMGKTIIPQKWLNAPVKYADRFLEKIPLGGRVYKAVKGYSQTTLRPAFNYWGDLDNLPKPLRDEWRLFEEKMVRGNKKEIADEFIKLQNMNHRLVKTMGADVSLDLNKARELGVKVTGNPAIDELFSYSSDYLHKLYTQDFTNAGRAIWGDDFVAPLLGREGFAEEALPTLRVVKDALLFPFKDRKGGIEQVYESLKNNLKAIGINDYEHFKKAVPRIESMITGGELPAYLKHTLTEKGRKFLEASPSNHRQFIATARKMSRGKPSFLKKRTNLGLIEDINKEMKPLMEKAGIAMKEADGFFEPNFFKNLALQAEGTITAKNTLHFYREMSDRFLLDNSMLTKAEKLTIKDAGAIGAKASFVRDGVEYVSAKMPLMGRNFGEGQWVPKAISEHLNKASAVMTGQADITKGFLNFYDKMISVWKRDVTGWFPSFHTRNGIGGMWNNWMMGLNNPERYAQTEKVIKYARAMKKGESVADEVLELGGKQIKLSKIVKGMNESNLFGQAGTMDTMRNIADQLDFAFGKRGSHLLHRIQELPQAGMETVENRLRGALFIDRLAKGEDMALAARSVYAAHFDYAPEFLTAFEKNFVKRIIPFYTWTRNNIPYQIGNLAKAPGKTIVPDKARRAIESMSDTQKVAEERSYLPDWLNEMFTIRLPDRKNSGEPYYLQLDLPIEDLNKLNVREILSMLSPVLKYPVELYTNKSLYFDTEIYDKSLPREYQLAKTIDVLKHLPDPVKDFLNIQEVSWKNYYTGEFEPAVMIDQRKLHFVRSLWMSRFYSTFYKALDKDATAAEKITQLMVGEPLRPIDMKESEWRRTKEYDVMLRDLLYHMLRTERMPYSGEEEGFTPGTEIPEDTFWRKLGESLPF
jgi:hypothetical protein